MSNNSKKNRNRLPPLSNISHRHRSETDVGTIHNLNIDVESFLRPNHSINNNSTNASNTTTSDTTGDVWRSEVSNNNVNTTTGSSSTNGGDRSLTRSLGVDTDVERLRLNFRSHTIGTIDPSNNQHTTTTNNHHPTDLIPTNSNTSLGGGLGVIGHSESYMNDVISTSGSFINQSYSNLTSPHHNTTIHNFSFPDDDHNHHHSSSQPNNTSSTPPYDDPTSITPIIIEAARIGNWDEVNTLAISHPGSAQFKQDGLLSLHHVCSRRCPNPQVFYNLIQAFPDALVDCAGSNGWTPLHYATRFKCSKDAVRLLLFLHKSKGVHASRLKCKENGRTPLYYAIRYEAPEGVVELLLSCMTKEDILESDKEGKSALGLIWGDYVDGSFSGRKIYNKHKEVLKHWKMKGTPWEERVENARGLKKKLDGSKMGVCWKKADLLLRGAFKFPLKDDLKERRRKWRILHAAVSMRNHKSLAMMALVLHPEQVREIDNEDLFDLDGNDGDGDNDGDSTGDNDGDNHTNHFTALHLAAKSFMSGREIIAHLLEMYPEAASIINPADNSYPLHYLCDNPSKTDWESDIAPIYNAYPEALLKQDVHGRTPFHRAFTVSGSKSSQTGGGSGNSSGNSSGVSVSSSNGSSIPPPAPLGTPTASRHSTDPDISVIQKILSIEPLVASISDNDGKLPFHSLAEHGEKWDLNIQSLYDTYPAVMSTRTNRQSGNNLPIHLVASNPDANASLVNKIIELNPRGASIENSHGRLPLHLVCESGKSFDGGFESIYNAYPRAIGIAERNDRGWLPLHFTVTCPNSTLEQIERVLDLNRNAASVVDGSNKTVLHLAIESGRSWDDGLKMLFDAYPDAIDIEDSSGRIPLVSALLTYQNGNHSLTKGGTTTTEEMHVKSFERNDSNDSHEMNENDNSLDELHVSQVNALYHLLKAAPSVLQRTSG